MRARPILMHARSVQNLLAGRKTQTRRIMKPQPLFRTPFWEWAGAGWSGNMKSLRPVAGHSLSTRCPYGVPGDLLWVRESVLFNSEPGQGESLWIYRADMDHHEAVRASEDCNANWRPSIHMPRRASRLTLRLTDVRVERIQEITGLDIVAEGCDGSRVGFLELWNDTNGPGAWERNDWVWALTFDVLRENVDAVLATKRQEGRVNA